MELTVMLCISSQRSTEHVFVPLVAFTALIFSWIFLGEGEVSHSSCSLLKVVGKVWRSESCVCLGWKGF